MRSLSSSPATYAVGGIIDLPAVYALDAPPVTDQENKGAHFSFISICHDLTQDLLDLFRPDAGQDGCGPDFIDTQEALPVLAPYVLAFGRRHVLGQIEWDPILTGPPLGNDGDFVVRVK